MKKIVSSVIAATMLTSTAAMAATVIAPTPLNGTRTIGTQDFNSIEAAVEGNGDYGEGADKVSQSTENTVELVSNPFTTDDSDKVLKMPNSDAADTSAPAITEFIMKTSDDVNLKTGDKFTISFDAAGVNVASSAYANTYVQLSVKVSGEDNYRCVFRVTPPTWGSWVTIHSFVKAETGSLVKTPASTTMTHYDITFDTGTQNITYSYNDGTKQTMVLPNESGVDITSIDEFKISTSQSNSNAESVYYIDNISYSVTSVTNEKVETFDAFSPNWGDAYGKTGDLTYASYKIHSASAASSQDIDDTKASDDKVMKVYGGSGWSEQYVAMKNLGYTMQDDDVFTFKFDYAQDSTSAYGVRVALCDIDGKFLGTDIFYTNPSNTSEQYESTIGLFQISTGGKIQMGDGLTASEGDVALESGKFNTITVVIDNSDEEYDNKRTMAVYVNGTLSKTKWLMGDHVGSDGQIDKADSRDIQGIMVYFVSGGTRYFDNLWATMTKNEITVDGNTASYTYPVVYDDETDAQLIVAHYNDLGRLVSATTTSATPTNGRTVTADAAMADGATKTKVFRWSATESLKPLTPAWDSSAQAAN